MALKAGTSAELTVVVDESMTADRLGNPGAAVFATPMLVRYFESAALQLLAPELETGQGSVGISLNVRHLAATPVGMEITFRATLAEVDGRRLTFRLEAADERETVGEGTHERFLVDMEKFLSRVRAKSPGQ
jgi:predicted thioesterase